MNDNVRENDLILKPNEYSYILDKTKGNIQVGCGPAKLSMSSSDEIVSFNEDTKRFVTATSDNAVKSFVNVPEGWYVQLKNPARNNEHPRIGTFNSAPELEIGKKLNICGACSFALYPGQMAKVIRGHALHLNEYLLVRAYDDVKIGDEEYITGQQIIIKGTEVSFYIPPTGLEVVPLNDGSYIRKAATLERIEYCILKNEQGEKKYIHGPAVVFPEPDEVFVFNKETNSAVFRAIELSEISGIYVKVVAEYADDNETVHHTGEELFITGNDQKIYYPRPEHAIIDYEGKILHHAIAIPSGEGRYVLNRKTGDVKMIKGPSMYLPDPREEVIVRRMLTEKQCKLWYPNNREVLEYNVPTKIEFNKATTDSLYNTINNALNTYSTATSFTTSSCTSSVDDLGNGFLGNGNVQVEKKAGFNRGNTYSKPRTITINNKFDGVVSIDVWTGYAINVVSKNGKRKVIVGPQTYLLGYDETIEDITVTDDSGNNKIRSVFLKIDNNKIRDRIAAQTKDFVDIGIQISYCVEFDAELESKWFNIEDYAGYLSDYESSIIKREIKKYTLEEFYNNAATIIRDCVLTSETAKVIFDNGMCLTDVEVGNVSIINASVNEMINKAQINIVGKSLELSNAQKELVVSQEIARINKIKAELTAESNIASIEANERIEKAEMDRKENLARLKESAEKAAAEAKKDIQSLLDAVSKAELAREKERQNQKISFEKERDKLAAERQKAYTDAVKKVVDSISPDLVAAITTSSQAEMLMSVAESLSPYALAGADESVSDVVNKLLRGTSLEGIIDKVVKSE